MAFVDESLRLAIGAGACAAETSSSKKEAQLKARTHILTESLTEIELERVITQEIYDADYDKEMQIWTYLEMFKRDNPHLAGISEYWNWVGGKRITIFTEDRWTQRGRFRSVTKCDKDTLRTNKNIVIELIMNTYGVHSRLGAEAVMTNTFTF